MGYIKGIARKFIQCHPPGPGVSMPKLDVSSPTAVKGRFRWQQYLAAILATLAAKCGGSVMGWTAPVLPYLQHNTMEPGRSDDDGWSTQTALSDEDASWVGALVPLGALIGALPAGWLTDRFGRRRFLLGLAVLMIAAWIAIAFAKEDVWLMMAARLILGATLGAVTVAVPLYVEEISEREVRGALGSYLDLMLALGIMFSYIVGSLLAYEWLAVACAALPIFFFASFAFMPESPVYLVQKGRWEEAEKSLAWLRGAAKDSSQVQEELHTIQRESQTTPSIAPPTPDTPLTETVSSVSSRVSMSTSELEEAAARGGGRPAGGRRRRATVRACIAVFGLMAFQQMSGVDAILFYLGDVFAEAGSNLSPLMESVITGVVQAVATLIASLVVDRIGRRPLLLVSAMAMGLSHAALAFNWQPLISVNLFLIFYSLGLGPLPWFMMAELLPSSTKSWSSGVAVGVNWSLSFVITKWFHNLIIIMGSTLTYITFCLVCVSVGLFILFFVPETRNKSREEIQEDLAS